MECLNLYAGLGGNRKNWADVSVTAVERDPRIAEAYATMYPQDRVIVADAHVFLLDNYSRFDFIWSSPPCQSHSRFILGGRNRKARYPDFRLYEEIIFLRQFFTGPWVVENVVPYYGALLSPTQLGRHLFWSNFSISPCDTPKFEGDFITAENPDLLKKWLGVEYKGNLYYEGNHSPAQVLRNCVHPVVGDHVYKCALRSIKSRSTQTTITF